MFNIINKMMQNNLPIETLPSIDPRSIALSQSGFPCDQYYYHGTITQFKALKKDDLEKIKTKKMTSLFIDISQNFETTMTLIENIFGNFQVMQIVLNIDTNNEIIYRGELKDIANAVNEENILEGCDKFIFVTIAPYIYQYNRGLIGVDDVRDEDISSKSQEFLNKKFKNEDEIFMQREVDPDNLVFKLMENLDIEKSDLQILVSDILNIPEFQAKEIVDLRYDKVLNKINDGSSYLLN